jgi:putative transposase
MKHATTIFNQLLSLISRSEFATLAEEHRSGRKPRKFSHWDQFVHLFFIQITARTSLRDGIRNMKANSSKLYHLGAKSVSRSTCSDANNSRSYKLFEALAGKIYNRLQGKLSGHKLSLPGKLYSLDASVVSLCLKAFPWAQYKNGRGGIKMHTLLDHDGYIPAFMAITEAKKHDCKITESLRLPTGSFVACDRGYIDLNWFKQLTLNQIYFVTRLKNNLIYQVLERNAFNKDKGITSDQTICMTNKANPQTLRRIGFKDQDTGKHYEFLTNNFTLDAETIADIYKERWEIEKFFRWIKQNLNVKCFIGRSENAVMSQIYVALIVFMIMQAMKYMSKVSASMQEIKQLLQLAIFERKDFSDLFNAKPETKNNCVNRQLSFI